MAAHKSTKALRAELSQPTVISRDEFVATALTHRPAIVKLSAQVSRLQELLVAVEELETDEGVQALLESLRQTLRAIDLQTSRCEAAYTTLSQSLRRFYTEEVPGLLAAIDGA